MLQSLGVSISDLRTGQRGAENNGWGRLQGQKTSTHTNQLVICIARISQLSNGSSAFACHGRFLGSNPSCKERQRPHQTSGKAHKKKNINFFHMHSSQFTGYFLLLPANELGIYYMTCFL